MLWYTMRTFVCVIVAPFLLAASGCEDKPASVPTTTTPPATQSSALKVRCPLCVNHEIEVDADTPRADYEGQTYYFCSEGCQERFLSDPAKFIARAKARAAAATRPTGTN